VVASIEIRPYESRDQAQVVALWSDVFRDDPPWNEPASMIRRKLTVQPELFLVTVADDQVVGTVMAGFDGVRGWIHHLGLGVKVSSPSRTAAEPRADSPAWSSC
jgi:hypothetical protein